MTTDAARAASAAEDFRALAQRRAPVFARLAAVCAEDPAILVLAARAQGGQNPPSLLLGAVAYRLAREPAAERTFWHRTVSTHANSSDAPPLETQRATGPAVRSHLGVAHVPGPKPVTFVGASW